MSEQVDMSSVQDQNDKPKEYHDEASLRSVQHIMMAAEIGRKWTDSMLLGSQFAANKILIHVKKYLEMKMDVNLYLLKCIIVMYMFSDFSSWIRLNNVFLSTNTAVWVSRAQVHEFEEVAFSRRNMEYFPRSL